MKQRCNNPNDHFFARYGAVGIKFTPAWDDFRRFLEDMGERPPGTTLDRIDNSLGYSKENCRWGSAKTQNLNRSMTVWHSHDGLTMCQRDWSRHLGGTHNMVNDRLRRGWTLEKALSTPAKVRQPANTGVQS